MSAITGKLRDVAQKKSDVYKYNDWPTGGWHSMPYVQWLQQNRAASGNPLTLPPPPVGTYDPVLDYNSGAGNRGFQDTQDDTQTAFEQGKQNLGLDKGDLALGNARTLADLLTRKADVQHQYGILGHQQAQSAAQHGITSAGLLGKSADIRATNEAHDIAPIDLASSRANEDLTRGNTRLDLNFARTYGGLNGETAINPLTGQPEFGSLLTGLTRAGRENTFFQSGILGQEAGQAAANGYASPLTQPNGAKYGYAGHTPLTAQQYQAGFGLEQLLRGGAKQAKMPYEQFAKMQGFDPVTLKRIA